MLVISVEMWGDPAGRSRETVGRIKIVDDETGTEDASNYEVSVATKGKGTRTFRIENHRRASGFWLLAFEVLKQFVKPTVTFSGNKPSVPPGR